MGSTAQSARIAVVVYSLAISGGTILFLILAQPLGIKGFDYHQEQNLRLIDVVLPTFFGYLGAASHFLFNSNNGRDVDEKNALLLRILIHGPFVIFILAVCALFFTYHTTNQVLANDDPRVAGLDFASLSRYLSICLALLAATVSILSSYLFGSPPQAEQVPK